MLSPSANNVPARLTNRRTEEMHGMTDERGEIADERHATSHTRPASRSIGVEAAAELTALRHGGDQTRAALVN